MCTFDNVYSCQTLSRLVIYLDKPAPVFAPDSVACASRKTKVRHWPAAVPPVTSSGSSFTVGLHSSRLSIWQNNIHYRFKVLTHVIMYVSIFLPVITFHPSNKKCSYQINEQEQVKYLLIWFIWKARYFGLLFFFIYFIVMMSLVETAMLIDMRIKEIHCVFNPLPDSVW